jgi:glycosyltransferase involved in cell wall biosynthesis
MDTTFAHRVLVAHPGAELYGADRVFLETVSALRIQGTDVVAALPTEGPLLGELKARGARVLICRMPVLRKNLLNAAGLLRLLKMVVQGVADGIRILRAVRPDVVYVSTLTIPLWAPLGKLFRVPVLTHVHEAEREAPRLLRFALAAPLMLSRAVIANSHYSRAVLTDSVPQLAKKTVVLYNGVPGPATVLPGRASIEGPLRLLYFGRLSPRKGADVAIRAVAALRTSGIEVSLDVVGSVFPGYEWYERELRTLVAELSLGDSVAFRGFQPVVWPYLESCDIALVTSRLDEPFGNTAVEALLAARPLVVSDTSGLREASAGYHSAVRVPPDDPDAISHAVQGMLEDWPSFVGTAMADAQAAAGKHSQGAYQAAVRDQINRLTS